MESIFSLETRQVSVCGLHKNTMKALCSGDWVGLTEAVNHL